MTDDLKPAETHAPAPMPTPEDEQRLMERHRMALAMADAAAKRPMALVALCEVAVQIAALGQAVGAAAVSGQAHPLGIYQERPAKVITHKNAGVERVLVAMRLDGIHVGQLVKSVAALQADLPADFGQDGRAEADPDSPIPGVEDTAADPEPGAGAELAKHQPCGCQVCVCDPTEEDLELGEERCHGCGAKRCGRPPAECNLSGAGPGPAFEVVPYDPPARGGLRLVK